MASVRKYYDDGKGYVIRAMTTADTQHPNRWYVTMGTHCNADLDIAYELFGDEPGAFYIGELNGEVVSSCVCVPASDDVSYGSLLYVTKAHRKKNLGKVITEERLRNLNGRTLVVDAAAGTVKWREETGWKNLRKGARYAGTALQVTEIPPGITKISDDLLEKVIAYDNQCYLVSGWSKRAEFLKKWFNIPGSEAYAAVDANGNVEGFGARRPAFQDGHCLVGPLYANSYSVAKRIYQALCKGHAGLTFTFDVCYDTPGALDLVKELGMSQVFALERMAVGGDYTETNNPRVFGVTSINVCSF